MSDPLHEAVVQALLDQRVIDRYTARMADLLRRQQAAIEPPLPSAEMAAALEPPLSRKELLKLAERHEDLRACADPHPSLVPEGERTPRLKWQVARTRDWYERWKAQRETR